MNVFYQIRDQILLKGRERGEVRAGQADSGGHHNIDPPGQVTQDAIEVEGITHHLTLGLKFFFVIVTRVNFSLLHFQTCQGAGCCSRKQVK